MSSLTRSASMSRTSRSQMYPPSRHRSARAFCGVHAPHRASMSSYETGRTRLGVGRMISCPYSVVGAVAIAMVSPPFPLVSLVLHPLVKALVHLGDADPVLLADHRHQRLNGVLSAEKLHHQPLDDLLPLLVC